MEKTLELEERGGQLKGKVKNKGKYTQRGGGETGGVRNSSQEDGREERAG